ncbi:MAG TPA: VOC family protein [Phototrophicaceae bacterium]|nr:VOC family protein [Phototrophicaceae bacterium]
MINQVDALVLFVEDKDKCAAFYRDVLGAQVIFSDDTSYLFQFGKLDFVVLTMPSAVEMVGAGAIGSGAGHRVLLCAGVENVDTAYQELSAKGLAFIKPPVDQAWGRRTCYFADPAGNLWELFHILPNGN